MDEQGKSTRAIASILRLQLYCPLPAASLTVMPFFETISATQAHKVDWLRLFASAIGLVLFLLMQFAKSGYKRKLEALNQTTIASDGKPPIPPPF